MNEKEQVLVEFQQSVVDLFVIALGEIETLKEEIEELKYLSYAAI